MLTANTTTLNLVDCWLDSDPDRARVQVNFPLNKAAGTGGGAVVYFEVQPGEYLARHTDSPEEILYIVAGTAEAEVGDETVKVVGFFCEPEVTSTFAEPMQPIGERVLEQAPVPAAA